MSFAKSCVVCCWTMCMALSVSSCSLINIERVDEPLTTAQINARITNRDFVIRFAHVVESAADSIIAQNKNPAVQLDAIRWKLHAIKEARSASYDQSPFGAMINTWTFCLQMKLFFSVGNGKNMFGQETHLALEASESLERMIREDVRTFLKPAQFEDFKTFVEDYATANPLRDITFMRESTAAAMQRHLGIPDSAAVTTVGTLPQVVDDYGNRIGLLGNQIPNEIRWNTQLFVAEHKEDLAKLDSLAAYADRIAALADRSPALVREAVRELRKGLDPILEELDRQRQAAMQDLRRERIEITEALHREREGIMKDLQATTTQVVNDSWQHIRSTIHVVFFWIVLILLLVLGIPFTLGYIVGRTLKNKRQAPGG